MTCIHPAQEWQWVCEKCGHHVWAAIDDSLLDGTEGAHPAWWRGDDHGFAKGVSAERSRIRNAVERAAFGSPRCVELHELLRIIG